MPGDTCVLSGSGSQPGTHKEVEMSFPAGSGQIQVLSGIPAPPPPPAVSLGSHPVSLGFMDALGHVHTGVPVGD